MFYSDLPMSRWLNPRSGKRCQVVEVSERTSSMKVRYESGAVRWVYAEDFVRTHQQTMVGTPSNTGEKHS